MAYIDKLTGEKKFTLKGKIAYHNTCANSGKDKNGNKLSFSQKVNHVQAANRCSRKLSRFMNSVQAVENSKKRGK